MSLYFSVLSSATEKTECTAQQISEDISLVPTDLLSNLVDQHENSIKNDEEYWNTPRKTDASYGYEEEEGITLNT